MKPLDRAPSQTEALALWGPRSEEAEPATKRVPDSATGGSDEGVAAPTRAPSLLCHCFCFKCLPNASYDELAGAISLSAVLACLELIPRAAGPCAYCGESSAARVRCAVPSRCSRWFHPSCALQAGGGILFREFETHNVLYPVCHEHAGFNFGEEEAREREERLERWGAVLGEYEGIMRRLARKRGERGGSGGPRIGELKAGPETGEPLCTAPSAFSPVPASGHVFLGTLGGEYTCREHGVDSFPFRVITQIGGVARTRSLSTAAEFCLGLSRLRGGALGRGAVDAGPCDCVYSRASAIPDSRLYCEESDASLKAPGTQGTLSIRVAGERQSSLLHYTLAAVFFTFYGLIERRLPISGFPGGVGEMGAPGRGGLPSNGAPTLGLSAAFDGSLDAGPLSQLSFARLRICPGVVKLARLSVPRAEARRFFPVRAASAHVSWNEHVGLFFAIRDPHSAQLLRCCLLPEGEGDRSLWGPGRSPGAPGASETPRASGEPGGSGVSRDVGPPGEPAAGAEACALILYICKFPVAVPGALLSVP